MDEREEGEESMHVRIVVVVEVVVEEGGGVGGREVLCVRACDRHTDSQGGQKNRANK